MLFESLWFCEDVEGITHRLHQRIRVKGAAHKYLPCEQNLDEMGQALKIARNSRTSPFDANIILS